MSTLNENNLCVISHTDWLTSTPALAPGDHSHFYDAGIVDTRDRTTPLARFGLVNPIDVWCQPRELNLYVHEALSDH